jgi:hypothetical protein
MADTSTPNGRATIEHFRRMGKNLQELEDRDRREAALRDPEEKIEAGFALSEAFRRPGGGRDEEPVGVLLMRRWMSLHD